ncbi:MAG: 50S ribosomal protein L25 [Acidimicrobiaceae bacterium]|nr:50S ribosomal protein L25 [Acidimicrobiaceae bacterium]MBT5205688.1 50S ribosomal protein L25 [Acidimicrobiaceae bacterium]MBT5568716.1 50S ribosomal protein L25 [Acidimicrobiaceae bacterium]
MSEIVLTADTTRQTGTRPSKRLRREQRIPAVVYGLSQDPVSIDVAWADLRVALTTDAGVNAVIHLEIAGEKQMSIVKDIQRHPVRRDVIHVDFLRIDPDQDVTVDVPLVMIGEAKAVTDADGMVDQNLFSLTVNASPENIPNELEMDISALGIGDSLRVADIVLPAGVTTDMDPEETVAIGMITRSTLEAMAAEEAAELEADGVELEGAGDGDSDGDSDGDTGDSSDDS